MVHMDRRRFLFSGLAALVALSTPNIVDKGVEMVARAGAEEKQVYQTIGDYYDSGTPSDKMPGARQCSADRIEDELLGFSGRDWVDYYFNNPSYRNAFQQLFREMDGKAIPINSPEHRGITSVFDFKKFNDYLKSNKDSISSVTLWYDGFMSFGSTYDSIVIPIYPNIVTKIEKL